MYVPVVKGDSKGGDAVKTLSPNGFNGNVELMVGFTADGTIHNIEVLSQAETPGLGAEITTAKHQAMYPGKTVFEGEELVGITLKKGGADANNPHEVDAISGGTKTSNGVSDMIKDCLVSYKPYFAAAKAAAVAEQCAGECAEQKCNEVNTENNGK